MKLISTLSFCTLFGVLIFTAVPAGAQLLGPEDPARSAVVASCSVDLPEPTGEECGLYTPPAGTRLVIETVTMRCFLHKRISGEFPVLNNSMIVWAEHPAGPGPSFTRFNHIPAIRTAVSSLVSLWSFGGPMRLYANPGEPVRFRFGRSGPPPDPLNSDSCEATIHGHLVKLN